MTKAIVVYPNGEAKVEDIDGYDGLVKAVGGYIELIHFTEDAGAYLNEEGKLENLPFNRRATELCQRYQVGLRPDDYIVGNMVIIGVLNEQGEYDGDEHDVPQRLIDEIVGE